MTTYCSVCGRTLRPHDENKYTCDLCVEIPDLNEIKLKKILIVDDTKSSRILLERMVKMLGMDSKSVCDGQLAIKENLKDYDIILMDIEMPIMNGLETTKYIRENLFSDIPIYGITAHPLENLETFKEYGFTDLISKPITLERIKSTIKIK